MMARRRAAEASAAPCRLIRLGLIERDREIEGERGHQTVGKVLESGQGSSWLLGGGRGPRGAIAMEQGREAPIHRIVFKKITMNSEADKTIADFTVNSIFKKENPNEQGLITLIPNLQRPRKVFCHPTTMVSPDDSPVLSLMPSPPSGTIAPPSISLSLSIKSNPIGRHEAAEASTGLRQSRRATAGPPAASSSLSLPSSLSLSLSPSFFLSFSLLPPWFAPSSLCRFMPVQSGTDRTDSYCQSVGTGSSFGSKRLTKLSSLDSKKFNWLEATRSAQVI